MQSKQKIIHSSTGQWCIENPKHYKGYGENCWGLTAGDSYKGYVAHCPQEDFGVIQPTAALSAFPYTPQYSMQALKHFYYDLGDKIWRTTVLQMDSVKQKTGMQQHILPLMRDRLL